MHLTVGEALVWIVGIGIPVAAAIYAIYKQIKISGKKEAYNEKHEENQDNRISVVEADIREIRETFKGVFSALDDKFSVEEGRRLMNQVDRILNIFLKKVGGGNS